MWGYGSHSFLNEYIRENRCKKIMEIGVANGENAKSMVEAAAHNIPLDRVEYYGFDLFAGSRLDQVERKLKETRCKFRLFKGDTIETLPEIVKQLPKMDLIFIDGGKSYTTAKNDWENSRILMHDRTAVFIHNYGFSGVRRMVDNIPRDLYKVRIIYPHRDYATALVRMKE